MPENAANDELLVRQCQGGNDQAFAELMRRHAVSSLKLASSILRDRSDAEDEVQTAFWKAYEHIEQFQCDSKFSTWLSRIVVNQCLMHLRHERKARFFYVDAPQGDELVALEIRDHAKNPEDQLGEAEIGQVLQAEISRIPPLLRRAFLLRDVEERPMPDVAAELGISIAAAKSRLLRARAELRLKLAKHCCRIGPATLFASHL